jgi:hypothetical protein
MLKLVALGVLATVHLAERPLVPLMRAMLWIGTLTGIASRTLPLHSPLSVLFLAHIIQHNSMVHQVLEIGISVASQL